MIKSTIRKHIKASVYKGLGFGLDVAKIEWPD